MKGISLLITSLVLSSIYLLTPNISPALAQDAPNTNVTKRRPDRPARYSPSPFASLVDTATKPEVKQVQTTKSSFFADLRTRIRAFFAKLLNLPVASSTSSTP